MKSIFPLVLIINILSLTSLAQDRIIKTTKDTIKCQVMEIGEDEVK